ncbi:MAG: glycoside hydrolase [Defluviitaleaceae bacterium]|nr:glycoside hydrolase [Defluviitaleaceae bacterium]
MNKRILTIVIALACVIASFPDEARAADNFREFVTEFEFLEWGVTVLEYHNGTLWATRLGRENDYDPQARRWRTGELLASVDRGESWLLVYEFPSPVNAIYIDETGNIFVTTTEDRWAAEGTGLLYKSGDGGATFRMVLEVISGVPLRWNIASQNGTMFVSEYGFKGVGDNARRIYRSLDFGETWGIIFQPPPKYNYHMHTTIITEDGTVYQSVGDGEHAKIIRSADNGYNWETVAYGFQPTSAVVFDTHILWGLDGGPWYGVARYCRQSGMITNSLDVAPRFSSSNYDMAFAHGIVYAMFLSYGGYDHPAAIFFSADKGDTWNLLGYITGAPEFGIGLIHLVTDDKFGYIDIGTPIYRGDEFEFFRGTLRFELLRCSNGDN